LLQVSTLRVSIILYFLFLLRIDFVQELEYCPSAFAESAFDEHISLTHALWILPSRVPSNLGVRLDGSAFRRIKQEIHRIQIKLTQRSSHSLTTK